MSDWTNLSVLVLDVIEHAYDYARYRAGTETASESRQRVRVLTDELDMLRHTVDAAVAEYRSGAWPCEVSDAYRPAFVSLTREVEARRAALERLHGTDPFEDAIAVLDQVEGLGRSFLSAGPQGPGKGPPQRPGGRL